MTHTYTTHIPHKHTHTHTRKRTHTHTEAHTLTGMHKGIHSMTCTNTHPNQLPCPPPPPTYPYHSPTQIHTILPFPLRKTEKTESETIRLHEKEEKVNQLIFRSLLISPGYDIRMKSMYTCYLSFDPFLQGKKKYVRCSCPPRKGKLCYAESFTLETLLHPILVIEYQSSNLFAFVCLSVCLCVCLSVLPTNQHTHTHTHTHTYTHKHTHTHTRNS